MPLHKSDYEEGKTMSYINTTSLKSWAFIIQVYVTVRSDCRQTGVFGSP